MAKVQILPWDPAEFLKTEEDVAAYLEAAREDGEPDLIAEALNVVERARGSAEVAAKWTGSDGAIGAYIREETKKSLDSYRNQPNNLREDANQEEDTARGGYANRQLFELVQNSADALAGSDGSYIWIRLTPTHFYCADNGRPIDQNGARALLFSHLSSKRGTSEIGRFGLGFKSVLGVTDTPEFFSRSGSFRFDRGRSAELLRPIAPEIEQYPVLRLAEPIDPWPEIEADPDLREMVYWAANIVRLPLKLGAHQALSGQIREFPAEFLLFVEHVGRLVLETDEQKAARIVTLIHEDDRWILGDAGGKTRWMIERRLHKLSADAKNDSRSLDDDDEVPISWAAPIDRLNEPGRFWAFFPTMTTSLLAGILNAPWKTNEDRQNLLPGVYNDELIDAAAAMVAKALAQLSTPEDPARHLDALPRRVEAGDSEHSARLRDQLHLNLQGHEVVPDQAGELQMLCGVRYAPREITDAGQTTLDSLARWKAYDHRPLSWLHHSALNRNRLAALERLWESIPSEATRRGRRMATSSLPRADIATWLQALVNNTETGAPKASMAAIQTAALIPKHIREANSLGNIVLKTDGQWVNPDPGAVFLGGGYASGSDDLVCADLEADPDTLRALQELGIRPASRETVFKDVASHLLAVPRWSRRYRQTEDVQDWVGFWRLARDVDQSAALRIIQEATDTWRETLRVRTVDGRWRSLHESLLPGPVVPPDGSRDRNVAIEVRFHEAELPLLRQLGAVDAPGAAYELSRAHLLKFKERCRDEFARQDLPRNPQRVFLNFVTPLTSGPLDVLESLSEEAKVIYTWHLLNLPATYERWIMRHDTQSVYPTMDFDSPAVEALRQHGRIETDDGIRKLSDGLGDLPQDRGVLYKLLSHPRSDRIRDAFELPTEADMPVEPLGEYEPAPLLDEWPGLRCHLSPRQVDLQLVRCDGFRRFDGDGSEDEPDCIVRDGFVYVARRDDDKEIRSILQGLGLRLSDERIEWLLLRLAPEVVQKARDEVRRCSTDEERLLAAVGEPELRRGLPRGLLAILEDTQESPSGSGSVFVVDSSGVVMPKQPHGPLLSGIQIAQAAFSTFHTGALREYRDALAHLDPPRQWAGRPKAVEFVRSLGFGEEWAGDSNTRREPFVEVDGPCTLPELHDYQRTVVENVRGLIRMDGAIGERRGMISMPTGSGKTRVAVQAIIEAIREDGFRGGILWVADRDELCEQAVEAWRQVWASEGTQSTRLRISRMWAGQPQPLPTGEMHVIVATIQTLSAKITSQSDSYEFLADFKLVLFDEAHRSVAPTFTSVMEELGLTRWRRVHEPLLIGLTATPYRGHDERETDRLANRYGKNRLDAGAFANDGPEAVIAELQAMRVLARADHATIEGGEFSLSVDELCQSQHTPWLPRSVEYRIASDIERTRRIIRAYREYIDPDWPTLVFATSVEHSQTVAALLNRIGIKARAVTASTDASIRRRVVEEFRAGEINALVNYGIFREGFDAPKTRAIVVARPVYSPNLYFQMIGRGLRGVKNGGNDRCLILNVRDNIANFERKLAFSDLDWLWA